MAINLDGLIPATVLPMNADGSIDEGSLRAYIRWIAQQGPVALAINVDTGEGPHLTHEEKVRVLQVVRDVTDLAVFSVNTAGAATVSANGFVEFQRTGAAQRVRSVDGVPLEGSSARQDLPERVALPWKARTGRER